MKYFSTFTGVLGFDMGLPDDWQCVGVSEIDKNACKVLRYRKPDVKNYGDIEKIRIEELPDFDILVGGSPCQGLSMAGKRKGLDDSRSRLFFSYIEILKEKKPLYFIFENVKGLLSSNAGWDFATVISEFTEAGYDIWWQVLDATQFGIPQHRERVFIFGTLRENGFRKVFFEPKNNGKNTELQGQQANTITRRYKQSEATGTYITERKFNAQIENFHFDRRQQNRIYGTSGVAPTLTRKTGGQQITKIAVPTNHNGSTVYSINGISPTVARAGGSGNKIKIVASRGRMVDGKWVQQMEERIDATNTLTSAQKDNMISDNTKIRYLTPLECERLMGWPDSWTKYGIDEYGKECELSDNQRYNLIGNGVVPQVVEQIINQVMIQTW